MASKKILFRGIEEIEQKNLNAELAAKEFQNEIPVEDFLENTDQSEKSGASRRDFLKLMGFSTAAVTLAACEAPVIKSIPYVIKPHNIIPGIPNYYASTYFDGADCASVLVKTREGRPIKTDPNPGAGDFGTTNARAQASVLSLYDDDKLKQPKLNKADETYDKVDDACISALNKAKTSGKKIVLLSKSYPSPTFKTLFSEFKAVYPTAELVTYDALPFTAQLEAATQVFGVRALPKYDLRGIRLVVAFQADFLNSYNGGGLNTSYAEARKPGPEMLRHIQVEGNMSLAGANADTRILAKPSEAYAILADVYTILSGGTSNNKNAIQIASELKAAGANAVVFADGSTEAQVVAHGINSLLGSKAVTGQFNFTKEFNPQAYQTFLNDLTAGRVGVLITNEANPLYSGYKASSLVSTFKKADFIINTGFKKDQMYDIAQVAIPAAHWLESWGDLVPATDTYALIQPTIQKVFKPRQIEESLLVWTNGKNNPKNDYYQYLKAKSAPYLSGTTFNKALFDGFVKLNVPLAGVGSNTSATTNALAKLKSFSPGKLEITFYTKTSIGDGSQANNPWLQELPDPITRLSWDNYITISREDAKELGLENELNGRMQLDGSLVNLKVNGVSLDNVPVFIQPGQAPGSIGLALGYGKKNAGKVAATGVNAYPLFDGTNLSAKVDSITKAEGMHEFAGMQFQNTLMGRYEIAKEVPLQQFINTKYDDAEHGWNKPLEMHTIGGEMPIGKIDLWDSFDDSDGPHFNLSVDLNACTGCAACIVACQSENNTPVVGKDEIRMSRDMYWLRIDRYYSTEEKIEVAEGVKKGMTVTDLYGSHFDKESGKLNHPAKNPEVIFQPLMCQHCNHAPCETVCPVAATSHGKQGQNQMAYNRCIGTRYCANNCPYKVRRFNWFTYNLNDKFDYNMNNDLGRMVLNPDVVVRTRGVMEKCSMCIQITQNVILEAKKEGRVVADDEFRDAVACAKACPSNALKFGDMNDKKSEVRKLFQNERRYLLLEEVGTKPNVFYQTKVRNKVQNKV